MEAKKSIEVVPIKVRDDAPEVTAIEMNPFVLLGATTRDNRKRIVELAEEKGFTGDHDACAKARADLTNPRNRLSSEISWLPGVSPKRATELLIILRNNPTALHEYKSKIPEIAHANLIASALELIDDQVSAKEWSSWIIDLAEAANQIEAEKLLRDINEDRAISGFTEAKNLDAIETEINERIRAYKTAVKKALERLNAEKITDVVTLVVDTTTSFGETHAPVLIDDMVDVYILGIQSFLEHEADKIKDGFKKVLLLVPEGEAKVIASIKLIQAALENWDKFAQPIQISMKSRGMRHDLSRELAIEMRNLAISLAVEHKMLKPASVITDILRDVFAELPDLAEQLTEDSEDLNKIAEEQHVSEIISPIRNLCDSVLEAIKRDPKSANSQAQVLLVTAKQRLAKMDADGLNAKSITRSRNLLAHTLMQCAIEYGNSTNKWTSCLKLLETAAYFATDELTIHLIQENLSVVRENIKWGGARTIKSAPTLSSINGFGFTLYGATDYDRETGSHIATYYFIALFIPIFPIARYRVIQDGSSFRFLSKIPLRNFDKWHLGISLAIIASFILLNQ
ncbi:MAG: hypothetical protein IPP74_14055 [Alphaproteobacteria bacterium]|nr:hypothetical protein [Alphaproteobacteria bacterium]